MSLRILPKEYCYKKLPNQVTRYLMVKEHITGLAKARSINYLIGLLT